MVSLLDSAGMRLDEGVSALGAFASVLAKVSELSGVVPQIALCLGPVAGGAVMLAAQCDIVIQAKCGAVMTYGPQVLAAVHGKPVDAAAIGGIEASAKAGVSHLTCETEDEAFELASKVINLLPLNSACDNDLVETGDDYARELPELNDAAFDPRAVIKAMADNGEAIELLSDYSKARGDCAGPHRRSCGGLCSGYRSRMPGHVPEDSALCAHV